MWTANSPQNTGAVVSVEFNKWSLHLVDKLSDCGICALLSFVIAAEINPDEPPRRHLAVKQRPAAGLYGVLYAQENLFAFGQ